MGKVFEIQAKSAKKSKKNKKLSHTRVHFILDESGSMFSCWHSTISGFNEYVETLRDDENGNTYDISLTKFEGGNIVRVFDNVPVDEVEELTTLMYKPSGGTNLNDAIGKTITEMMEIKGRKKQNNLVIIMTDGYENMSRKWTKQQISSLITQQEKKGWTITFLGANIDTVQVGSAYSISSGNMKSYSTENMARTMRGLATATTAYACSATVGSTCDSFFEGTEDWTDAKDSSGVILTNDPTQSTVFIPPKTSGKAKPAIVGHTTNQYNIQTGVWGHDSQTDVDNWKKNQVKKGGKNNE